MSRNKISVSVAGSLLLITVILNVAIIQTAFISGNDNFYGLLLVTLPMLGYAVFYKKISKLTASQKPFANSRGLCWYKMLRSRPRHYFTGAPPVEKLLKQPLKKPLRHAQKASAYRSVKRHYDKMTVRKPS